MEGLDYVLYFPRSGVYLQAWNPARCGFRGPLFTLEKAAAWRFRECDCTHMLKVAEEHLKPWGKPEIVKLT